MARGSSGRVVVEVDPRLKRDLYSELARQGLTLKAWFVAEAEELVASGEQPSLFGERGGEPTAPRRVDSSDEEA